MTAHPHHTESDAGTFRVAVIGGGIAGLAAAHRVRSRADRDGRPVAVELFEAAPVLGGSIGTLRVGGFLVEYGPDMFVTDKPWAVELVEELGLGGEIIETDPTHRRSLVLRRGRPEPVPPGFTLMSTARIWPVLRSRVLSTAGKLRLAWERFVPRRRIGGDESLASFARRRLGREVFERLVQPLVGGIYTADPERLSLRATLPRFLEMEREHGSLTRAARANARAAAARRAEAESNADDETSGARYGMFVTLRRGLATLVDALERSIGERDVVRKGTRVGSVVRAPEGWSVTLETGEMRSFDAVVIAAPSYVAAGLLGSVDETLAARLRAIEYASSALVCSGFPLDRFTHPLDAFGLVVPHVERRSILAVSVASRKFPDRAPDGHVLLRTFVGGALQPEVLENDDAGIIAIVRDELRRIFGLSGDPVWEVVRRYDRAMPQYHVGHLDRVEEIERLTTSHPGLALAGNAYRGVGIPDCIHSGRTAADRLLDARPAPVIRFTTTP